MIDVIKKNKVIFIIFGVLLVIFLITLVYLSVPSSSEKPQHGQQYSVLEPNYSSQINIDIAVNDIIHKLPYQGKYFSLKFDIATNKFIATLDKNHQPEANAELDKFLTDNKIPSRESMPDLIIQSK